MSRFDLPEGPQAPTQGWMEGRVHHYPLRVFYEDTDYADSLIMLMLL